MPLNRVRVAITGVSGLPGVATFHVGTSITDQSALRTFWDSIKATFPNTMIVTVANTGDVINEDNGQITGAWNGAIQANVVGTGGAGSFMSAQGPMVRWSTPQVVNGRRPIGKTFLVPAVTAILSASGTIGGATQTIIQNAATALIVALGGELKIYHRPSGSPPHGGVACTITAASVSTKSMVLRSRRD